MVAEGTSAPGHRAKGAAEIYKSKKFDLNNIVFAAGHKDLGTPLAREGLNFNMFMQSVR